jgi:hypothetical protein
MGRLPLSQSSNATLSPFDVAFGSIPLKNSLVETVKAH